MDHDHGAHGDHHAHHLPPSTTNVPTTDLHHSLHSTSNPELNHDSHSSHSGMQMSMTFHGGYNETVLFSWWNFDSVGGLFASIFAIFTIAVLYEGLKYYREYLFYRTCNGLQYRAVQPPEEKASPSDEPRVVQPTMCSKFHLWQTFLHAIQVTVSYLLMLVFMTYNSWLCLAVVAGAACGNFLFGWKKSIVVDVTEHCH